MITTKEHCVVIFGEKNWTKRIDHPPEHASAAEILELVTKASVDKTIVVGRGLEIEAMVMKVAHLIGTKTIKTTDVYVLVCGKRITFAEDGELNERMPAESDWMWRMDLLVY